MGGIFWRRRHAVPRLIIFLIREDLLEGHKGLPTSTRQRIRTLTQVFLSGLTAKKSAGSTKDLWKSSSTLQHLLTTLEWAIASGESLVGSFVPSYLKAGCFRCWRGWIRRLTKEKTTWSPVIPLFLDVAMASRRHLTWPPPCPVLIQHARTWGRQEFSLEVEIQSSRHETRNFSTRLLYPRDYKICTCPKFQDRVSTNIPRQQRVW